MLLIVLEDLFSCWLQRNVDTQDSYRIRCKHRISVSNTTNISFVPWPFIS